MTLSAEKKGKSIICVDSVEKKRIQEHVCVSTHTHTHVLVSSSCPVQLHMPVGNIEVIEIHG